MITPVQKGEEFLSDFRESDGVTGAIHVWWLGQSSYLIKWSKYSLLFDPLLSDEVYRFSGSERQPLRRKSERVVDPIALAGIDFVVCSSLAPDRFDPGTILDLRSANPNLKLVLPAGAENEAVASLGAAAPPIVPVNAGSYVSCPPFDFHGIDAATPRIRQDQHGNSKELGYVAIFGPFSVFFCGGTAWHTHLVKQVRRWPINLAILPICGSDSEADGDVHLNGLESAALAKAISASIAMPAHYGTFEDDSTTPEEFERCAGRLHQRFRVLRLGQRMTMGPVSDPSSGKAPPSEPQRDDWALGY